MKTCRVTGCTVRWSGARAHRQAATHLRQAAIPLFRAGEPRFHGSRNELGAGSTQRRARVREWPLVRAGDREIDPR
jgi:hypothetical protein